EGRNFLITQLVAEIARSYYELVALDGQLAVLEKNIGIQQDALAVVKQQKDAARVTQLAVTRFEAEVLKNRARLFDLRQQRTVAENRINFLVGRTPRSVDRDDNALSSHLPKILHAGVPTDLLRNRPDIRQAELRLQASKLDVDVARAAFLPALSIDAEVGFRAFNPLFLLNVPEALAYNLAGNLAAPILNRPQIEATYKTANALQIQAVIDYERTTLRAFTDVVNQLVVFNNLRQSYDLGAEQVKLLENAIETSNVLFTSARADYMEVLLTRRDALDAELELIETRKRLWTSTVDLYQALGGGWRDGDNDPGAPTNATTTTTTTTTTTAAPPATTVTPAPATTTAPVDSDDDDKKDDDKKDDDDDKDDGDD
ncbi:MAG TPA: TolC family protein, partial [Myxococcota bacterium]